MMDYNSSRAFLWGVYLVHLFLLKPDWLTDNGECRKRVGQHTERQQQWEKKEKEKTHKRTPQRHILAVQETKGTLAGTHT